MGSGEAFPTQFALELNMLIDMCVCIYPTLRYVFITVSTLSNSDYICLAYNSKSWFPSFPAGLMTRCCGSF